MTLRRYLDMTREPRYAVLFAFPLLALYEGLAFAMTGSAVQGVRNGADVLLKTVFVVLGGARGVAVFTLGLVAVGLWLVARDWRRHPGRLDPRVFAWMLGESIVYALMLGGAVSYLTTLLLGGGGIGLMQATGAAPVALSLPTQLVISLGAGLYEELLFRVLLVSGLAAGGIALGWKRTTALIVAVVVSAVIFSAFHYVGPLGDTWTPRSFTFRAVAGLVLSGLYVLRGFGIVAWSHALYDVWVSLLGTA